MNPLLDPIWWLGVVLGCVGLGVAIMPARLEKLWLVVGFALLACGFCVAGFSGRLH